MFCHNLWYTIVHDTIYRTETLSIWATHSPFQRITLRFWCRKLLTNLTTYECDRARTCNPLYVYLMLLLFMSLKTVSISDWDLSNLTWKDHTLKHRRTFFDFSTYPIYHSSSVPYIAPSESPLMGHNYTSRHRVDFISGTHLRNSISLSWLLIVWLGIFTHLGLRAIELPTI